MKSYIKAFSIVALSFILMGQTRFPPQGGGVTVAGNNTWTGTQTFGDEAFLVCDDGDGTKCIEFETSGITTGTTRTQTWLDTSGTILTTELAGNITINTTGLTNWSWSGASPGILWGPAVAGMRVNDALELYVGTNSDAYLAYQTSNTPDSAFLGTSTDSNAFHLTENADGKTFDFENCSAGTSAQTNPTLCWHSADQATNEWGEVNTSTAGMTSLKSAQELMLQSGQVGTAGGKSLTESSATAVIEVSVAQGAHTGGTIHWTVVADDSTNFQALTGSTQFQAVNPTGTEVCTVATTGGTDEAASSGTLTNTVTCTVGLTDVVQIAFNAASSLTQTTLVAYHTTILNGPGTVTPQ